MSGKTSIDDELNRLLAGEETELAALYRKLPAAEPDEKLDAAVLAMAHRAVNPHLAAALRQDRRRPQRPRPWMFALGSVAGLVLAAGVSWQLRSTIQNNGAESALHQNAPALDGAIAVKPMESERDRAPAAAPAAATAPSPVMAPPPPPAPAKPAAPSAPLAAKTAQDAKLEPVPQAPQELKKEEFAQDEAMASADTSRREQQGVTQYTLPGGSAGPAPKPTPFPAHGAKPSDNLETVVVTGSRIKRADIETASPVVVIDKPDSVERKAVLATGGNHALAESAASGAPAAKAVAAAPAAQPATANAAPALAGRAAPASPAPSSSTVLQNNSRLAPPAWIGVMQQLLRDERRDEARENLALFRRKYPDYVLPADLKKLLDHP